MAEKENSEQEKYIQLQLLAQQLQHYQNNIELIEQNLTELKRLKLSLEEFSSVEKGKTILVPLGQNIFTKAKLENTEDLIVGIGSNILIKKTIPETKESIGKQEEELITVHKQLQEEMQKIYSYFEQLQEEIKKEEKG